MKNTKSSPVVSAFFLASICLLILGQYSPVISANPSDLLVDPIISLANYPNISIIGESDQGMILEFSPPEPIIEPSFVDGSACQNISIDGMQNILTDENMFLPVQGTMLGIPFEAEPKLTLITANYEVLLNKITPCPLEKPIAESNLVNDQAIESLPIEYWRYEIQTGFSPSSPAQLIETGYIRNQRIAQIRFNPIQYNPASGELRVYKTIRVEIRYATHISRENPEYLPTVDPFLDDLLSGILINPDRAQQWRKPLPWESINANDGSRSIHTGYKIMVDQDGIYEISYEALVAAGITPEVLDELDPRTFQVFNQSIEIPIFVNGEQEHQFTPGDSLIFYGQKTESKFTNQNAYWLNWGNEFGLRMVEKNVSPSGTASIPEYHLSTQKIEQDLAYFSSQPSGLERDHWYWDYLISTTGNPQSAEFEFELNQISESPHSVTLRGLLKGYSASPNHRARIFINSTDQLIADVTFPPSTEYEFSVTFPSDYLVNGLNRMIIEANPDGSSSIDFVLINRFELEYHGRYVSHNDRIVFSQSGHWEFVINGFSTDAVLAYNITDPLQPELLLGDVVEPAPGGYQIRFETQTTEPLQYLVLSTSQYFNPLSITQANPADLKSTANSADYIIITHGDFLEQMLPLADLRSSQGYRVQVVNVQDIYDVFNDGIFSPEAIRSFLSYTYTHWVPPAPSFVLLVGDGHYDFKDNLGYGESNYIPPYIDLVDPIIGETATDNRFVSISGDDVLPDMHIGRFPVRSSAEAQILVEKTIIYEVAAPEGEWKTALTFIADNTDSGGNFSAETDHIISQVSPGYSVEKIYLGSTHTASTAKTDIKAAINAGRLIVHYAGHGSIVQWASEGLLKVTDLPALTNQNKLPFMLPMTCSEGYFIKPSPVGTNNASLGESIVRMNGGGAVGSWSPTGFGMAAGHMILENHLVDNLFNHNNNQIGYLTTQAKYHLFATTSAFRDLIETYVVFGDPALRLNTIPIALEPPSNLMAAAVSGMQVDLSWKDNSSNETGFRIERSHPNMENWVEIGVVNAEVTIYSDTGLNYGTTYHYRVRAFRSNDGAFSEYSPPASATTINLPAAPTDLTAVAISNAEIVLHWKDNSIDEAGFEIERSLSGLDNWTVITAVSANVIEFHDLKLTPATTYYYRVRAYLSGSETYSSYSNIAYDRTYQLYNYFYPLFSK